MLPADIPSAPFTDNTTIFLHGPAGAGKTTLARQRLRFLLRSGVPPQSILVLVPQRTLGLPYQAAGPRSGGAAGRARPRSRPTRRPCGRRWTW